MVSEPFQTTVNYLSLHISKPDFLDWPHPDYLTRMGSGSSYSSALHLSPGPTQGQWREPVSSMGHRAKGQANPVFVGEANLYYYVVQ
jgi:hypothetical protein